METPYQHVKDVLSRDEIREFVTPNNLQAMRSLLVTWGLIVGSFALVAWWTHPLTILVALVILGGRQLGLAILMHDAAHRVLFRQRWLNDSLGKWLCAAPIWQRLGDYRTHHLAHHTHTGTDEDPDLGLSEPFPTSTSSMFRKFARDLFGISGLKRIYGLLAMDLGYIAYTASVKVTALDQTGRTWRDKLTSFASHFAPVLVTNLAMWGLLFSLGLGWLYLLWLGAYLSTFSLFIRIRSFAEHACTHEGSNLFLNTRTTYAGPLARLTVAPHQVNYHLEHHLLMTVPHYKLPRMHKLLKQRGALEQSPVASGYWQVIREVTQVGSANTTG
ncbi:MAG: fatty acid desaturase [Deltaproteobacteria bacterium]|nr:MAG: fatty acid desaturase [Deltaproteobacteria bacterium]